MKILFPLLFVSALLTNCGLNTNESNKLNSIDLGSYGSCSIRYKKGVLLEEYIYVTKIFEGKPRNGWVYNRNIGSRTWRNLSTKSKCNNALSKCLSKKETLTRSKNPNPPVGSRGYQCMVIREH